MRLLFKNNDDNDKLTVMEVLCADQITNMETLLEDDGYDEIKDLPGIVFCGAVIESLPLGNCCYSNVIMICRDEETVNIVMHDIAIDGYLDSTKYVCKVVANNEPQQIYDLLRVTAEEWYPGES